MRKEIEAGVIVEQRVLQDLYDLHGAPVAHGWMIAAYAEFAAIVSNDIFPCLFGRSALRRQSLTFLFVRESRDLVAGVAAYTAFVRRTGLNERLYSPLVIVFERTGFDGLAGEHAFCWEQLSMLHANDLADWPENVPADPADSRWTFCFDGVQLFFNMSCPGHRLLKSRNLGQRIIFIVNPRQNFDAIASLNSRKGTMVRQTIRERVCRYNNGIVPAELGFFGDDSNLEWKQYQLSEPGTEPPQKCPFAARSD